MDVDDADGATGLVRIPGFSSRSGWRWLIATAVAVVGIAVFVGVTQPENRVFVVTLLPVLVLFWTALVWQTTWLDPVGGALVRVRFRVWRRVVRLEPGTAGTVGTVGRMAVAAPARGSGTGRALLDLLVRRAAERGTTEANRAGRRCGSSSRPAKE